MVGGRCHGMAAGDVQQGFFWSEETRGTRPFVGHGSAKLASIYKRQCRFRYGG